MMKISICVLTYNRKDLLDKLIGSLLSIELKNIEIIVIDNNSSDGTNELACLKSSSVLYYKTNKNIGVAARNIGLRTATGNILICLDDDVFGIGIDEIKIIINEFETNKNLGAINFKVIDPYSKSICNWVHHCKVEEFHEKTFSTYEITEGAVAFSREALGKSGLYSEYFFLSHEGPDLAFRIIDSGYEVKYNGSIVVYHYHSTLGRKPWYRHYYDTRNHLLLAVRNFPIAYALRYLFRCLVSTFIYSVRDRKLLYWIKAILDGIKMSKTALKDRIVLSDRTMTMILKIDENRPELSYMLKKRLLRRGMRF